MTLPELEVCPLFLPGDGAGWPTAQQALCLPSPEALSDPGWQLSLHVSLNVRNMFSAPGLSSFLTHIPLLPTCCWSQKSPNKSKHKHVHRALYSSRDVNLSKSLALAKASFPLQCQCFFAPRGPSIASAGNGTQGLEGLLSCLASASRYLWWPAKHPCLYSIRSPGGN